MPLKKYLDYDGLDYLIQRIPRTKIRVTFDEVFAGETATCSMGTTTYTKTVPATEPYELVFPINELGTWTIATSYLGDDYGTTIEVTAIGQTATGHVSYVTEIDGATVEPTDDITTWLKCANIEDSTVTTLADVLANRSLFETLIANSNACKYMARSTSWAGNPSGEVPKMTSATTPSGVVSTNVPSVTGEVWQVFDKNDTTGSQAYWGTYYIQYEFPSAVNFNRFYIKSSQDTAGYRWDTLKLQGSNDGSTFTDIANLTNSDHEADFYADVTMSTEYKYFRVVFGVISQYAYIAEIQFYKTGITLDADAMSLIGKYDYCSNALLSNATWAEAIANSDYFESVFDITVPIMTSNTTPSGVVSADSYYSTGYEPWRAFARTLDASHCWHTTNTTSAHWIRYQFTKSVRITHVSIVDRVGAPTGNVSAILQGSNDGGSTWEDIATLNYTVSNTGERHDFTIENNNSYLIYGLWYNSSPSNYIQIQQLQFYGRASEEVLIPLVPTMTSDTTPSGTGTVICNSYYSGQEAYRAFNGNLTDSWSPNTTQAGWIGFHFDNPTKVSKVGVYQRTYSAHGGTTETATVQGSNDGSTWIDISDTQTFVCMVTSNPKWIYIDCDDSTAYTYFRLNIPTTSSSSVWATCAELQFYAKAVQTNIIHSAANDTIYMMENGSPVVLTTTNSDGDGILDFTQFMDGTYTLYSSVAKDPTNLSNDYSKSVRITKTSYGCTTEAYLMPDTIKTLYWWGWSSSEVEECSTANGWSYTNGLISPTYNTNNMAIMTSGQSNASGIAYVNVTSGTYKAICETVTNTLGAGLINTNAKAFNDVNVVQYIKNSAKNIKEVLSCTVSNSRISVGGIFQRGGYIYAFWKE